MFKQAVKYDAKLRMALSGPAGAGKTWTALTLATALADGQGVALIDTEHGSASKYADQFAFDVQELSVFDPRAYVNAIQEAEQAGYAVLIIDSLSHAWNGRGGLLEIVDNLAARKYKGNTFNAWKDATPLHNQLIDTIIAAKLHIIVTMRSKMDHVQERNENTGRTEVRKVGMAPVQRDGMEYEFDIVADLDISNTMVVQKSRCPALSGRIIARPDGSLAVPLKAWLQGVPAPEPLPVQETSIVNAPDVQSLRKRAVLLFPATPWDQLIAKIFGGEIIPDDNLTPEDLAKIKRNFDTVEQRRASKQPVA